LEEDKEDEVVMAGGDNAGCHISSLDRSHKLGLLCHPGRDGEKNIILANRR